MSNPKFEIFRGSNNQYYFRLRAKNGEIILQSEGYHNKVDCKNGTDSVKRNAPNDSRYERLTAKNGEYYFNLTAENNKVIGTSETYKTKQGMETGIASVKENAPVAEVVDLA